MNIKGLFRTASLYVFQPNRCSSRNSALEKDGVERAPKWVLQKFKVFVELSTMEFAGQSETCPKHR